MIPNEIINIILFKYLDDIDININFGNIRKLKLENYSNIDKILKYKTVLTRNDNYEEFIYRFITINSLKFYRLTLVNSFCSLENDIITEIASETYPIYFYHLNTLNY